MSKKKRVAGPSPVSLAVAAALWATAPAYAQEAERASQLGTVAVIEGEEGPRVEEVSSPKYTAPLLETPQTITVVTQELIAEQNLLSLRDVLSTVPGITFGAGEGGGGYGDSITLRGFAGSSDVTSDGIRDSAQYTRSDPFNLEQVEVINGANSVYSGAGSLGGTINLVSKGARLGDAMLATVGVGTDGYIRVAGDLGHQIGETTAVRLNVMGHRNDVPGRDVENAERWGVAPSVGFGLGTNTTVTLAYLHQHDDNTPQYGVPTYLGRLMQGVDREAYYGYRNVDEQVIDTDALTATISHTFSERYTLRNLTRWQEVSQRAEIDAPQGTFCLENNLQPNGIACPAGYLPGQYQPSGNPRGNVRDTTNQILVNQTDLTSSFDTGSWQHTVVTGVSLSTESYFLDTGNQLRNPGGALPNPVLPRTLIADPDDVWAGPVNYIRASTTDGRMDNRALYVFDNIRFNEHWSFNGGARVETNEAGFQNVAYATPASGGAITPALPGKNDDTLFSYRAGIVFMPTDASSIYLAYGNTETPSVASVNGTCTVTGANNNCNLDPEEGANIELGTKWDLLDRRLSLTAAISRNDRSNYRVNDPGNPDNPSGQQTLDGEARVDAVILGVAGLLADNWSIFANYTFLKSEVLQGASQFVSDSGQDYTRGDPLLNVPRHSASLWTTWDVMRGLQLGYGVTYQGEVFTGQHTAPTGAFPTGTELPTAASYVVHRAMASYRFGRALTVQLNVNNIFDKEYLTRVRTQPIAWATPGEAQSFVLSANLNFQ